MGTIAQDASERRNYKQNGYKYLLNDEEKTAWIVKGPRIGRCHRYRIPNHVIVNGERYDIERVEIDAFEKAKSLRHLIVPDSIIFIDEYNFSSLPNLRSIYIGKGLKYLSSWIFGDCPKLTTFEISLDNPHLCIEHGTVYTKDGKRAVMSPFKQRHIVIKEGVEVIENVAFWWNDKLKDVHFPSTVRKIGDNSLAGCPKLRSITLPEGVEECVVQSFQDNEGLEVADLPSTMKNYGCETFNNCPQLNTLIIRTNHVLELNTWRNEPLDLSSHCTLKVPKELVEEYRQHPLWGNFRNIIAID